MDAKRHLLIVDDDPDLRHLAEYFETNGFTVSSVADSPGMRRVLRMALPTSSSWTCICRARTAWR
jgi:DNA-binding response OmpR family regulator